MKTMTITPSSWDKRAAFTLTEGDRVIVVDTQSNREYDRPTTMSVRTVARIMGGAKRQWIELDDKTEWTSDGQRRGGGYAEQMLYAYDEAMLAKNRAECVEYKELEDLVSAIGGLTRSWDASQGLRNQLKRPEVRATAKTLLGQLLPKEAI